MTPRSPSEVETKAAKRRGKVEVVVYNDTDWELSGGLIKFEHWLSDMIELIPTGYRRSARIEFDSEYDSSSTSIKVTYERPETDEEFAARKVDVNARLKAFTKYEARQRREKNQALATALGGVPIL